jgi:hypothetical protein
MERSTTHRLGKVAHPTTGASHGGMRGPLASEAPAKLTLEAAQLPPAPPTQIAQASLEEKIQQISNVGVVAFFSQEEIDVILAMTRGGAMKGFHFFRTDERFQDQGEYCGLCTWQGLEVEPSAAASTELAARYREPDRWEDHNYFRTEFRGARPVWEIDGRTYAGPLLVPEVIEPRTERERKLAEETLHQLLHYARLVAVGKPPKGHYFEQDNQGRYRVA